MLFYCFQLVNPITYQKKKWQEKRLKRNLITTGEVKWALEYSWEISVILHGSVERSKVSLSEKNPQ